MHEPPPSEPSVLDEVARNAGRAFLQSAPLHEALHGAVLIGLMIVFVPLGLLYLLAAGVTYYVIVAVILQVEGGALSGVVGAAYWIGVLVLMFLIFRRVYRWLEGRLGVLRTAADVAVADPRASSDAARSIAAAARGESEGAGAPSLAELDARHAPAERPADASP